MNSEIKNWTDLVADSEHISEDLQDFLDDAKIKLNCKQEALLIEFIQVYMHTAIETALDEPDWFK